LLKRDLAGLIKLPSWFSDVIPQLVKGAIDEANTRRAYSRNEREKLRDKGQKAISYLQESAAVDAATKRTMQRSWVKGRNDCWRED
jgi:hypothetical protein